MLSVQVVDYWCGGTTIGGNEYVCLFEYVCLLASPFPPLGGIKYVCLFEWYMG